MDDEKQSLTPTPRTDRLRDMLIDGNYKPHECFREWQNSHRMLERELAEAWEQREAQYQTAQFNHAEAMRLRKQRDRLSEALGEVIDGRHGAIVRSREALAAVKNPTPHHTTPQ